ncbi:MAG: 50S ribosomal protein L18 [Gemmatimonadota bacterium]|nr:50S ribosomal protein L18 [Gemmatimonadota bacterium]MCK5488682.1 50S ribosomal protein L18 [Gemmatimonadota bacterium]
MALNNSAERRRRRATRHKRVLKKVRGTAERPRLVVFRSLKNIEGQLVDDDRGATLLGISTLAIEKTAEVEDLSGKMAASYTAGRALAEKAKAGGIESIVFDRGGYRYQGRVKAFADGARAGGLKF